jgi:dTDP-4-amino-4,6-dideoxygalactose transaminase
MKVAFNNLYKQWEIIEKDCKLQLDKLFEKSNFILGEQVEEFENKFSKFIGTEYAIGVSNGTDALKLSVQALDLKGTTCFVIPANTYIATLFGPEQATPNATIKLIDCDEYFQMEIHSLEEFIRSNRSAFDNIVIIPVHLYGYSSEIIFISQLAAQTDCRVVEDASQAHGAKHHGQRVGSFGDVAAFSLYPGKNLGAAGDAGIITTNDKDIYERVLKLRNMGSMYGGGKQLHEIRGGNHRLDTIQAIILNEKIKYIDEWNAKRREVCNSYSDGIANKLIKLPKTPNDCEPVHHVYPVLVEDRSSFTKHLDNNDIQWGVHYKACIEETSMYSYLGDNKNAINNSKQLVSLPIHPFMETKEVEYVIKTLNQYKGKK